ncbi:hypothetical protein NDU88_008026 [Pleurodeles waltl]|uniref:Uncharacterized protein n=1 Tax=Pleurodeles waltl TaxID=8319 RepID=A0AAV7NUS0_PLEWA|nr:hypothetical protein NDU88_008025 [Pleurodeles waltl]KAJ1119841.1 hypothetical protein NDU88_008026 [Pleurodeles waltl]
MIPCSNRFGPLGNDEGLCNAITHKHTGSCTEGSVDINPPLASDSSLRPHDNLDLSSVYHKLDEVKNLVLSLTKLLIRDPRLACGCNYPRSRLEAPYFVTRGTSTIAAECNPRFQADNQFLQPSFIPTSIPPTPHIEGRQAHPEVIQHKRVTNVKDQSFRRLGRSGKMTSIYHNKDQLGETGPQVLSGAATSTTHRSESPDDALQSFGMRWAAPKKQAQAFGNQGSTLFLVEVPKLSQGVVETPDSLLNKVITWLRAQRKCLSVIRADIVEVD